MGPGRADDRLKDWRDTRREVRAARDALAEAQASAGLRRVMGRRTRLLLPVIGGIALIVAAIGIWYAASAPHHYSDDDYLTAATSKVKLLLNVDSGDPDRAEKILQGATGSFYDAFGQSADSYSTFVRDSGAHGEGTIDAAAVQWRSADGAAVLIAASVQVSNNESNDDADDPIRNLRLVVTMVPENGDLKIDGLVLVP
ncbi:hypothetical protein [Gordonia hydrophobica]|uniref:Mce-associated membrane protein n=1 Tax=Gordonia hydrophobica TaxID=40516 RepID=A0ABZ2TWH8_9ACTN|nr:hypothetical protein [Gordonia hydrophobica]MBM7365779.1 Mce-associated membrane protein [Gordonia hydrophobica]